MKAVGYHQPGPLSSPEALLDVECPDPAPGDNDIVVRVRAASVNPVDYKVRASQHPAGKIPVILGWDAAGVVTAAGKDVRGFSPGDEVYYAGDRMRQGTNAELHAVDFRLAARKPKSLNFADAAALPLTALTAYEALFEKLRIPASGRPNVLIIGGAGGVGSIAVQLLRAKCDALVYATYGRPESLALLSALGAQFPLDRTVPLQDLRAAGKIPEFDFIFSTTHTREYLPFLPDLLRPFGELCLIDDPDTLDIAPFKRRALSVHWELMFTKSLFGYRMETQGSILAEVAALIDSGKLRSTAQLVLRGLSAANVRTAHELLESGRSIGKIVLDFG